MGGAFVAEPREWFKGLHVVMFSMRDPDWVLHKPSQRCSLEAPHEMSKCGEFRKGGNTMGILSKIERALGLKSKTRRRTKKRRTPPRKANGEFRKRKNS